MQCKSFKYACHVIEIAQCTYIVPLQLLRNEYHARFRRKWPPSGFLHTSYRRMNNIEGGNPSEARGVADIWLRSLEALEVLLKVGSHIPKWRRSVSFFLLPFFIVMRILMFKSSYTQNYDNGRYKPNNSAKKFDEFYWAKVESAAMRAQTATVTSP